MNLMDLDISEEIFNLFWIGVITHVIIDTTDILTEKDTDIVYMIGFLFFTLSIGCYYVYKVIYPNFIHHHEIRTIERQIEKRKILLEHSKILSTQQDEIASLSLEKEILELERQKTAIQSDQRATIVKGGMLELQYQAQEFELRRLQAETEAEIKHLPLKKYLEIIQLDDVIRNKSEADKYSILIDKRRILLQEYQSVVLEMQSATTAQNIREAKKKIFGLKSDILDTNILLDLYEKD